MTDQSRVEAVADVLARELGCHRLAMIRLAEDVVEANDAWLKADRRAKDKAVLKAEYPTTPRRPDK